MRAKEDEVEPRWRVGRKLGRTLYLDGECVGMVDGPNLAAHMVVSLNADPRWAPSAHPKPASGFTRTDGQGHTDPDGQYLTLTEHAKPARR